MIKEFDIVGLTRDMVEFQLSAGSLGTVVHVYPSGRAYEVEFVRSDGTTQALFTLTEQDIRPATPQDLDRARLAAAE